MNTTNIISTPGIEGNIGSCTTQIAKTVSGRPNLWKKEITAIATNSCTGEVTTFQTWEYTPSLFFVGLGGVMLAVIVFWFVMSFFIAGFENSWGRL